MTRLITTAMLLFLLPVICHGQLVEPDPVVETVDQTSIELDFAIVELLSEADSGWLEFSYTDSSTGSVTYGMLWADEDDASGNATFGPPTIPPNPQTPPGPDWE